MSFPTAAVVLVGGQGTRLRPLTDTTPKPLLPVVGVPILERVLGRLAAAGVRDAVLALGYGADAFIAAYPDGEAAGVRLHYAVEPEPYDTAGAVAFAARHSGLDDRALVVVNGDILTDGDLVALAAFHAVSQAEATIALTPVEDPSRYGVVPTDESGRVLAFVEKPAPGTAPTNFINAGTYVLEPSVVAGIPAGRRVSIERETFPALAAGGRLFARGESAYWADLGTPASYLAGNIELLDGTRPVSGAPGPGLISVEGGWVDDSAVVGGHLLGACAVGARAVVAGGAVLDRVVLGPGSRVASWAKLRNVVVLAGAEVGPDAEIQDSVIGAGARVGCRTRLLDTLVAQSAFVPDGADLEGARITA